MARTRSKHYPDNQNLILDAAAKLFAERGFHRASISELAAACDFSKSWLYHYYDSKEAILFALLSEHLADLTAVGDSALAAHDDPEDQFRAYVRAVMVLYADRLAHHTVLTRDMEFLPDDMREKIRAQERRLVERFVGLLRRLRPEISEEPARQKPYAMMFFGMLNWTYTWYDPDGPIDARAFAEMAADLYLHGFRSNAASRTASGHREKMTQGL